MPVRKQGGAYCLKCTIFSIGTPFHISYIPIPLDLTHIFLPLCRPLFPSLTSIPRTSTPLPLFFVYRSSPVRLCLIWYKGMNENYRNLLAWIGISWTNFVPDGGYIACKAITLPKSFSGCCPVCAASAHPPLSVSIKLPHHFLYRRSSGKKLHLPTCWSRKMIFFRQTKNTFRTDQNTKGKMVVR